MTAAVVLANLMYPAGAIAMAMLLSSVVVLRHRKPKSVEANVATFKRGLQALAPGPSPAERRPVLAAPRPPRRGAPPPAHFGPRRPDTSSRPRTEAETG